jgi:purine nucleosidase
VHVPGNVTPVAEFNIAYDPVSADHVFSEIPNTVLLPLDVTSKLLFTRHEMDCILSLRDKTLSVKKIHSKTAKHDNLRAKRYDFLEALTLHTFQTNMAFRETEGVEGFLVHDASVVAMLVYPHLFK